MDLLENADMKQSLIVKENDLSRDIYTLNFDLNKAITQPQSEHNFSLMPYDEIIIFSSKTIKDSRRSKPSKSEY